MRGVRVASTDESCSHFQGFTLDASVGEFVLSHPQLTLPDGDHQRIFSGNCGNTALWAPPLRKFLEEELIGGKQKWQYRYIGALVGDFHRTLLYGGLWLCARPTACGRVSSAAPLPYALILAR